VQGKYGRGVGNAGCDSNICGSFFHKLFLGLSGLIRTQKFHTYPIEELLLR
jgi:hypothetical protein